MPYASFDSDGNKESGRIMKEADPKKIRLFYRTKIKALLQEMVVEKEKVDEKVKQHLFEGGEPDCNPCWENNGMCNGWNAARAEQLTKLSKLIK